MLTAFEPFGANDTNISQKVLDAIQADVAKLLLPVSFRRAPKVLNEAIGQFQPDVIISMGKAAEGDKIRLERLAINMMDSAKGDNDGYIPNEELICPEAPLALKTALPVKQLCADCINAGLPTMVSNSEACMSATASILRLCDTPQIRFSSISPKTWTAK